MSPARVFVYEFVMAARRRPACECSIPGCPGCEAGARVRAFRERVEANVPVFAELWRWAIEKAEEARRDRG